MFRKVTILSPTYLPNIGGVEKTVKNELDLLKRNGIKADLITSSISYSRNESKDIKKTNHIHLISAKSFSSQILFNPISLFRIIKKKKKQDPIFHIHTITTTFAFISILFCYYLKCDYFITPHYHPVNHHKFPFIVIILEYIIKFYTRKAKYLIAITEDEVQKLQRFNENIVLVPHGVSKVIDKENLNIETRTYALFVGRLAHNKGVDILIKAANNLNYKIIIAGKKIDANVYTSNENITFMNEVSDNELEELYRNAKVLILPSRYEAFGLVAIEALSYGCPIIVSDQVKMNYILKNTSLEEYIYSYDSDKMLNTNLKKIINLSHDEYYKLCLEALEIAKDIKNDKVSKIFLEKLFIHLS